MLVAGGLFYRLRPRLAILRKHRREAEPVQFRRALKAYGKNDPHSAWTAGNALQALQRAMITDDEHCSGRELAASLRRIRAVWRAQQHKNRSALAPLNPIT